MQIVLRQLCGTCLSDEEMDTLVHKILTEAAVKDGLRYEVFERVFATAELNMIVEMPVYMASM